ncbi:MAG: C39 family peptidase [Anaerolineae bacterium]|nr:C39 family peptidase [Anaerolineae bacterium]
MADNYADNHAGTHATYQDRLPYYAAGTLPPDEIAALNDHLIGCADCRAALAEWFRIADAVRADAAGRASARRVSGLPPLRLAPRSRRDVLPYAPTHRAQQAAPLPVRRNGRTYDTDHDDTNHTAQPIMEETRMISARTYTHSRSRRRAPAFTLIAAVLVAVLFGGALLFFSARIGDDPGSGPGPAAGVSSLIQASATATPIPTVQLPTVLPPTPVPPVASTTPIVVTVWYPSDFPTVGPDVVQDYLASLSAQIENVPYEPQGWNNSGPAALSMVLQYYHWDGTQEDVAAWTKPGPEDKWVTPWQLAAFANEQAGLQAIYRMGGTLDALKRMVAAGYPVIVNIGSGSEEWYGHYAVVTGYDDVTGTVRLHDSFRGADQTISYDELDESWRQFNRTFIVVYRITEQYAVANALGNLLHPVQAINLSLESARQDVSSNPRDIWGWLNMGRAYTAQGDYNSAVTAYEQALAIEIPLDLYWRLLWYAPEIYEAYYGAGDYETLITLADQTLDTTEWVEDSVYWLAMAYAAQGQTEDASAEFSRLLRLNPNYFAALRWKFQIEALGPLPYGVQVNWTDTGGNTVVTATPALLPTDMPPATAIITPTATPTDTPTATPTYTPMPVTMNCLGMVEAATVEARTFPAPNSGEVVYVLSAGQQVVVESATPGDDPATRWYGIVITLDSGTQITGVWVPAGTVTVIETETCPPPTR